VNIFDVIDGIAFSKKPQLLDNVESESQVQPYMVNRWLSMLDPAAAIIINGTANKYHGILTDKKMYYKFMTAVLPQYRKQRIHYIKKPEAAG